MNYFQMKIEFYFFNALHALDLPCPAIVCLFKVKNISTRKNMFKVNNKNTETTSVTFALISTMNLSR